MPKTRRNESSVDDPRFAPAVALLGRTGAAQFSIRYCDEDWPVVWIAAAKWGSHWAVAAALDPIQATFRLCDEVIDGGQCTHCKRPTGFEPTLDTMPLDRLLCWYQWDPERSTFRRGCALCTACAYHDRALRADSTARHGLA